jgi:hypothetical protein
MFVDHSWTLGCLGQLILIVPGQAKPEPVSGLSSSFEILALATASFAVAVKDQLKTPPFAVTQG